MFPELLAAVATIKAIELTLDAGLTRIKKAVKDKQEREKKLKELHEQIEKDLVRTRQKRL